MSDPRTVKKGTRKRPAVFKFSKSNQPKKQDIDASAGGDFISQENGCNDVEDCSQFKRISQNIADAVPQDKLCPIIPFKLRSLKTKTIKCTDTGQNITKVQNIEAEYGILKLCKVSELFNNFLKQHMNLSNCNQPNVEFIKKKHNGLCITAVLKCKNCSISSDQVDLFDRIDGKNKTGPAAGCLNEALPLACLKTKMGMKDIQFFLSTLSIQPPTASLMQKKLNKLCDLMVTVNEQSMVKNQELVKQIIEIKNEKTVSVETDVSYNNRLQLGYEAGTQAFAPMIENVTNRKLTLSLDHINRLCQHKKTNCQSKECHKNYPDGKTMASSETQMIQNNIQKINRTGILEVGAVTSDACSQISKVCKTMTKKPIRHFTCYVHKMRNFQKHIHFMQLTPSTYTNGLDKSQFTKQLGLSFRKRVQKELGRLKRRCRKETEFVKCASLCIRNVIDCFSNNHTMCQILSTVCEAHKECYRPSFLPGGKHLTLSKTDHGKISSILAKDFSHDNLHELFGLTTTNKSESMHNRLMTYITKRVTWSRNFSAMCHSAVHSDTVGTGQSTIILAKEAGISYANSAPMFNYMQHIDSISRYHKD